MLHEADVRPDGSLVLDQNSGIGFRGADFSSTVQEGFEPRTMAYVVLCEAQVEVVCRSTKLFAPDANGSIGSIVGRSLRHCNAGLPCMLLWITQMLFAS